MLTRSFSGRFQSNLLIPQVKIRIDYDKAGQFGVAPGPLLRSLEHMLEGERIGQIIEGNRRFDLLVRLPDAGRGVAALPDLLIETPTVRVPLSKLATVEDSEGPNRISRENAPRRSRKRAVAG